MGDVHDRLSYFEGQLLSASDFRTEQQYHREQRRVHNQKMHGWGVVSGCQVTASQASNDSSWAVSISSGYALTPTGEEIDIIGDVWYELPGGCVWSSDGRATGIALGAPPSASQEPRVVGLAVRAIELLVDEVPGPGGPQFSRIRDAYELACVDDLTAEADASVLLAGLRLMPATSSSGPVVQILPEYRQPLSLS